MNSFLNPKTLLLVLISIFSYAPSWAQNNSLALGRLDYEIKVAYVPTSPADTNKKYYTQSHYLLFNAKASLNNEVMPTSIMKAPKVISLKNDTTELNRENIKEKEELMDAYNKATAGSLKTLPILNTSYHAYSDQEYLSIKNHNGYSVVTRDTLPVIKWSLTNEAKEISGYKVNKAIGTFRGRNYTAWYTKKIPVPAGPWKLYGLPGLILEAYDDSREIILQLTSLAIPTEKFVIEKPKPNGAIVDQKEFIRIQRKRTEETSKMLRAANSQTQSSKQLIQVIKLVNMER